MKIISRLVKSSVSLLTVYVLESRSNQYGKVVMGDGSDSLRNGWVYHSFISSV